MAARRKSTKKTGATAAQKQKTASARRATRGSGAKGRLSAKRGETVDKPKEKPATSKVARKRLEKAKAAPSSARSRTKVGGHALTRANAPAKTNKKGDRARRKVTTTASGRNPKRVEAKLQTKIEQKSRTNIAARVSTQEAKTGAVTPERDKTTSSSSAEASVTKAATSASKEQKSASRETHAAAAKAAKPGVQRQGFKLNEFVVYPAHGVGQIVAIEEREVAGFKLELFVISFSKDKMTLRVPTSKGAGVGMRKISDPDTAKRSLEILTGRARVKRTMWSRRAQEYEAKINSGDINAIAEVVRDLYRSDAQPEQSYSERQLYEAALDRMVREIAAVQRTSELDALRAVEAQLQRSHGRSSKASAAGSEAVDPEIEEAA
jgi:CarD family transcriptional regulator, regulator of rRNA transcription